MQKLKIMRYYCPLTDTLLPEEAPIVSTETWKIPLQDLESLEEKNTSIDRTLQCVWDSTSIHAFKRCPRFYKWTILDGYRLYPMPPELHFGIAQHTVLETWHRLLTGGMSPELAQQRCIRLAGLLGEYIVTTDNIRTKETLVRTTVWYTDQFWNDPAQTIVLANGKPAVEYSFVVPLTTLKGVDFFLAGHIDRIASFLDEIWPCDYKTTSGQLDSYFVGQFKPNIQVQVYTLAGHILAETTSAFPEAPAGLLIDGIALGVNFTRFQRFPIRITKLELESFLLDLKLMLQEALMYVEADHWPARESSCGLYGGCTFRRKGVCTRTPSQHEMILKANFKQKMWDPAKPR